ncbi:hypothetical protein A3L25_007660 [Pseudomonas putida]|uniref:Imidazoleglycerol-phosphate synthase n=1 Tax=Pseudomonas putida TaxID=303 RepID=A0AAP9MWT9_PSEPU|nr:hypothetical protein [Pseudomonas putida]QJQ09302.1 hypothetical protein A3L25_007660 [Pseudomonas putida]
MVSDMQKATLQPDPPASVRLGWGGVLALDRTLLDLVLREQYLQALANLGSMDPINLEAYLDDGQRISVALQGLVLGPPQLSFENATLMTQDLTLRMNILAGEYMRVVHLPGSPKRVVESFTITEAMGFRVEAPLSIRVGQPKGSRFTLLELDLASAVNFSTNLGPNHYSNTALGLRLQESISYMRAYQRTYSLGRFVMDDYYPLSPEQFMVRTMAAPWGQSEDSPLHGDGAVLVFMKLGIDARPGVQPEPGIVYAYPIAEGATGVPGALILVPDIEDLGAGDYRGVLKTFSLPTDFEFLPGLPNTGVDLVVPGNWRKRPQAVTVEPAFAKVVAGKAIAFTADGATGPVQWSAVNLKRPAAIGSFSDASYSPRSAASFVEDQQMVLVTATATSPEASGQVRSHALVMESARAVHVAPRVATWVQGEDPIELRASSVGSGALVWTLVDAALLSEGEQRVQTLDEPIGKLEDKGDGRAIFTPSAPSGTGDFRVQRIRCTNQQTGESAEAAVVVIKWLAGLNVVPFHVGQALSVQPTPFTVMSKDFSQDLGSAMTWTVSGEGVFDGNVYMPPDNPEFPIAVVTAFDRKERTGYAIVEFSEGRQATAGLLTWEAIATFEVEAVGAPRCFANGWQQIMVRVTVAAASDSNHQPIKISDADMATLKFLNLDSNNDLPFLAPMEESLNSDAPGDQGWAVNKEYNNIQRQAGVNSGSSTPLEARTHYFYLHCRRPGKIKVIASIQNTLTGYTVTSRAVGEVGKLELTGQDVPPFAQRAYSFTRTRAIGDTSPSEGDEFAYVDKSTDNWLLEYVEKEGRPIKFARLFISDNKSGVRWSWEPGSSSTPIKDDDFVSYTGFSFRSIDGGINDRLLFDGRLYRMAKQRGYPLPPLVEGKGPGAGELMITLNRDTGFVRESGMEDPAYRQVLEKNLTFTLLDMEGNVHPLTFAFGVTAEEESRGISHRDLLKLSIR